MRVSYSVTEAGTARFCIELAPGSCSARASLRCAHRTRLPESFAHGAIRGRNALHFTGRLSGRRLAPGEYKLVIRVVDSTGDRSRPERAGFRITP